MTVARGPAGSESRSERTKAPQRRSTRQRSAILEILSGAPGPLLPAEILGEARRWVPSLGLATVYRNLNTLVAEGQLRTVALPGEASRYEVAGKLHHHYFSCKGCEKVFELGCGVNTHLQRLVPEGFALESHEIVLYGRCQRCS